jgi:hypothetical protein
VINHTLKKFVEERQRKALAHLTSFQFSLGVSRPQKTYFGQVLQEKPRQKLYVVCDRRCTSLGALEVNARPFDYCFKIDESHLEGHYVDQYIIESNIQKGDVLLVQERKALSEKLGRYSPRLHRPYLKDPLDIVIPLFCSLAKTLLEVQVRRDAAWPKNKDS